MTHSAIPEELDEVRLDDVQLLSRGSADEMLRSVAAAGAQVREAAVLTADAHLHTLADDGRPRALVVAGVGTAARVGEALAAVAGSRCTVPVLSHLSAGIPGWVGAADVVIAVSASGHGPEALAAAEAAAHRGARLVAVGAADSPLQATAERAHAVFVPVPPRRPARVSFWGLVVPVLMAGRALGLVSVTEADLAETAARLDSDAQRCRASLDAVVNAGKSLAVDLAGNIPVIWGSSRLAAVAATRFADQLAANAHYPAVSGSLVEASRARVGLLDGVFGAQAASPDDLFADREQAQHETRLRLVIFRDEAESAIGIHRAEAVVELASTRGIGVNILPAEGMSPLERLASLVTVPDFASVYLALLHGMDPITVPAVSDLKDAMTP
ncbi:MAG: mannose-6-phosphate isomerase [Acidimicrobiales bacterium]|nr:MAG: mannose-6-phosphate isomerase [Acidimicrobiales bacterium]